MGEILDRFLPPLACWFRTNLGRPTAVQEQAWLSIAQGQSTLVFAPTGSGKTLAAFFAGLDHLWRHPAGTPGVRLLYVSPLKALNEDIARNLRGPLAGIREVAARSGAVLDPLSVAVRTGDTPAAERQRIGRRPPDILITTPESLNLMLTSRARDALKRVSHVIVDEIHAVASNKRGVFLALLLERLEALHPTGFVRIGLSATQRPLEEAARYLGGWRRIGPDQFEPRPVTIVEAGTRKDLELEVSHPGFVPAGLQAQVWPAIEDRLAELIEVHRSTIVFTNNRRTAERLAARLSARRCDAGGPDSEAMPAEAQPGEVAAHHGSLSQEHRRATEDALKRGTLRGVVATASLELGIDMGAVDLVCQVESPGSVSRALQRVGRSGHLVDQTSKGQILAKSDADLLECAALARSMFRNEIEELRIPIHCLDVLAQQVIACVAVDRWDVAALFDLVRGAHSYHSLTPAAFEAVLELVSGRYHVETFRDLRPRISWDRVHNRLHPLPGTAQLALVQGGTIPDTGQLPVYLGEGGPRLGELDEEFVFERRVGETFVFGSSTWRIEAIEPQRIIVSAAAGSPATTPFWRGEKTGRTAELGRSVGALCRELVGRLEDPDVLDWLQTECHLDESSAARLCRFVARQAGLAGAVPDDQTLLVESFRDAAGESCLAVLTPWGNRLHHALKLALGGVLRRRLGITVTALHGNEGVLFRLPGTDAPPTDLFRGLTADQAESWIREEVGQSALFGLRFRQNAGRALLMPRTHPGKRTPLWLQRLRAKDLLQAVRQVPDFPLVVETYRECLEDDLELPRLREVLEAVCDARIRVIERRGEVPSPFTSGLLFAFEMASIYEWDDPRATERRRFADEVSPSFLDSLRNPAGPSGQLDPSIVSRVEGRLRGAGLPPRSADEMAERLRRLGDLAPGELEGPMKGFLEDLIAQGRVQQIHLEGTAEPIRWILTEEQPLYDRALGSSGGERAAALESLLGRYLRTHALVTVEELAARYPIDATEVAALLERWSDSGSLVLLDDDPAGPRWCDRRNLEEVHRTTRAVRRRETVSVAPEIFADFLLRHHGLHPDQRPDADGALETLLRKLNGFAAEQSVWESELLPRRLRAYQPSRLDEVLASGRWLWRTRDGLLGFFERGRALPIGVESEEEAIPADEGLVLEQLRGRGASFVEELARWTGLTPSRVRQAIRSLMRQGLVTNDRFDPVRLSAEARIMALTGAGGGRRRGIGDPRRASLAVTEGRWSVLDSTSRPLAIEAVRDWAEVLLDRHLVLCRETAALDPWAPDWRELVSVLDAAERRGDIHRGYFVEGLSGVQFARKEASASLAEWARSGAVDPTPVLVSTGDPANLYGSGAPFDIPLLEGGTVRLARRASNLIALLAGRPILVVEARGRRLSALPSASENEIRSALGLLTSIAGPAQRVVKVETYNRQPVLSSPAAPWLRDLGFVRDPPGMAYYQTTW